MDVAWGLLLLLGCVSAYPNGAPKNACMDMFPVGHKVNAETSDPPYTITTNTTDYRTPVLVTLRALNNGYFEGVFIQARRAQCGGSHEEPLGTYILETAESRDRLKLMDCKLGTGRQNALTHSDKIKKGTLQFVWVPPSQNIGTVYFRGTFVKETTEFWTTPSSGYLSSSQGQSGTPQKCAVRMTLTGAALNLTSIPYALSSLIALLVYSFTSTST